MAVGSAVPLWLYIFGLLTSVLLNPDTSNTTGETLNYAYYYLYIGLCGLVWLIDEFPCSLGGGGAVCEIVRQYCFRHFAETQMYHLQTRYFEKILRQETAWHETKASSTLVGRSVRSSMDHGSDVFSSLCAT